MKDTNSLSHTSYCCKYHNAIIGPTGQVPTTSFRRGFDSLEFLFIKFTSVRHISVHTS